MAASKRRKATKAGTSAQTTRPAPKPGQELSFLGPGLILAGSIVGSGELIATTRTGAEAGFALLWLIILGCVLKVFTQVEIARHCVTHSETTVTALDKIPYVGRFIALFWLVTFLTGLAQLGGIVGGVGQALQLALPIYPEQFLTSLPPDSGAKAWAVLVTVLTIALLIRGGFRFIETFCVALVGTFTLITIANTFALQSHAEWAISGADLREGLSLGLPASENGLNPLATALATFGIIGVGAAELVAYPYWCLEKGYGRWIGPRAKSDSWLRRAKGWLRVLQWDAWGSMIIYTTSTVAFYLLGAAVLHRQGLLPEKSAMVSTLSQMYVPVFGNIASLIFLAGAVAVLFSTFFVSSATKARLMTDALHVFRIRPMADDNARRTWVRRFSVLFPLISISIYLIYPRPLLLVLISGLMQALLLPLLGIAALYFRYAKSDPRLRSGKAWDVMLWLSFAAFSVIGIYLMSTKAQDLWKVLSGSGA